MSAPGGGERQVPLAAGLALLSYVPFEYVAKGTLLVCAFLFIVDPFPPLSRFVALLSLLVVAGLSRLHKEYNTVEEHDGVRVDTTTRESNDPTKED
jgi:hypothetical protein